jgi:hypothetical protein
MPTDTSPAPPVLISQRKLWFGATAAAIAWALQGAICEVISAEACQSNLGSWGQRSPTGVKLLLAAITIVALGFAIGAGVTSFRNWRLMTDHPDFVHAEGRRRQQFMALVGAFAGVVFVIGILWAGIPLIMLDVCVKAR